MSTEIEKERCVYREMPIPRWKRPQRDIVRWVHGGVDIYGRLIAKRLAQQVRHSWNTCNVGATESETKIYSETDTTRWRQR